MLQCYNSTISSLPRTGWGVVVSAAWIIWANCWRAQFCWRVTMLQCYNVTIGSLPKTGWGAFVSAARMNWANCWRAQPYWTKISVLFSFDTKFYLQYRSEDLSPSVVVSAAWMNWANWGENVSRAQGWGAVVSAARMNWSNCWRAQPYWSHSCNII